MKLPAFSVIIFFFAFSLIGYFLIPLLPVRLMPDRGARAIAIYSSYPGASAAKVEQDISLKLEGVIATLRGVNNIRTVSLPEQSSIAVTLDEDVNIREAKLEISTLVRQLYKSFPANVSYPLIIGDDGNTDGNIESRVILSYTLSGPSTVKQLSDYFNRHMRSAFEHISGVKQVFLRGIPKTQLVIRYDEEKIKSLGLSSGDISNAVGKYLRRQQLGKVSEWDSEGREHRLYLALSEMAEENQVNWQQVPVTNIAGHTVLLGDITNTQIEEEDVKGYLKVNGVRAINIDLIASGYQSFLKATNCASEIVQQLNARLPRQYKLILQENEVAQIKGQVNSVALRILFVFLVTLILGLTVMKEWGPSAIIILTQLCAIGIWCIFNYLLHYEINIHLLVSLCIGLVFSISAVMIRMGFNGSRYSPSILNALTGGHIVLICSGYCMLVAGASLKLDNIERVGPLICYIITSFFITWLLVPALCEKLHIKWKSRRSPRFNVIHSQLYVLFSYSILYRCRILLITLLILLFGVPIFLLPQSLLQRNIWGNLYNQTFGSDAYQYDIKPSSDRWLGGTLGVFLNQKPKPYHNTDGDGRTELHISMSTPPDVSSEKLSIIVQSFETYILDMPQLSQFKSTISNGHARIEIQFKEEYQQSSFPFFLKAQLEEKAAETGLASFIITGIGAGFDNARRNDLGNYMISIAGYNYQQLYEIASGIRSMLLKQSRVKGAFIRNTTNSTENEGEGVAYNLKFNGQEGLIVTNGELSSIGRFGTHVSLGQTNIAVISIGRQMIPVVLKAANANAVDLWRLMHVPLMKDSTSYLRLLNIGTVDTISRSPGIMRENQQYTQVIHYTLLGDEQFGEWFRDSMVVKIRASLPIGYKISETDTMEALSASRQLFWAITLSVAGIFVICSIVLNNLRQSLAITLIVIFSFIGIFINASLLDIQFKDCYLAFFMGSGFVVTGGLLIVSLYNELLLKSPSRWSALFMLVAVRITRRKILLSAIFCSCGFLSFLNILETEMPVFLQITCVAGNILIALPAQLILLPLFLQGRELRNRYNSVKKDF
jgi:multidrug efflux pump subunit AcrB